MTADLTDLERAVNVKAAAIRLSVDEKTIRRLIQRGGLRGVRVGRKALRIVASDLDRPLGTRAS